MPLHLSCSLISGLRRHPQPEAPSGPQPLHLLSHGQAACRAAPYSVQATSRTTTPRPDLQQQRQHLPHGAFPPLPLPPQELALTGQQAASAHAPLHACMRSECNHALVHSFCLGALLR